MQFNIKIHKLPPYPRSVINLTAISTYPPVTYPRVTYPRRALFFLNYYLDFISVSAAIYMTLFSGGTIANHKISK